MRPGRLDVTAGMVCRLVADQFPEVRRADPARRPARGRV